jgi:hypothetical protein
VFSGMIGVALFGIFLTPVFFFVLLRFGAPQRTSTVPVAPAAASPGDTGGSQPVGAAR